MNPDHLARGLAASLTQTGTLVSDHWRRAFENTPRHSFVDAYFQSQGGTPTLWKRVNRDNGEDWLAPIYTNVSLVTRLDPRHERPDGLYTGTPTSSSTQPSLTARMLEAADIKPDDAVLDAGTGTGYQAALIAHRLRHSRQMVTADIDPELTAAARSALSTLGYEPGIIAADVSTWKWDRAFDKVIVTCALPSVTPTLREAVAPGGRLIANLFPPVSSALVVLDAQEDGRLEGRFHPGGGSFMPARPATSSPPAAGETPQVSCGGDTEVPLDGFDSYHFAFLLAAHLPGMQLQYGMVDDSATRRLTTSDRSWAEATYSPRRATFSGGGDKNLWERVEQLWEWFTAHGRPTWDRFGLTVTGPEHRLWFESPADGGSWPLRL